MHPFTQKADAENVEQEMKEILQDGRIEAEIIVLPTDKPRNAI